MNEIEKVLITKSSMDAIGSAIRDRNGLLTKYLPSEMPTAIESIPNNYTLADEGKVVKNGALIAQSTRATDITANGTYDTTENNSVTVDVSGGGGGAVVQPLNATQNGTYNPPSGVDGFAPVVVNVSGGDLPGITFSPNLPQASDGVNGDYWYVSTDKQRAPVLNPTSNAQSATTGGNVFTAVEGTSIVGLAFFARTSQISVHLSTLDGTELAGLNDVDATPDQWNEYTLENPVTLQAGTNYIVWGANDSYAMKYASSGSDAAGITYVNARYTSSRNVFPTSAESGTRYGVAVLVNRDYRVVTEQYFKTDGAWQRID